MRRWLGKTVCPLIGHRNIIYRDYRGHIAATCLRCWGEDHAPAPVGEKGQGR